MDPALSGPQYRHLLQRTNPANDPPMILRNGQPPRPGLAYRQRPGAYAILPRDGLLLLTVQRAKVGPEVQLPGGGIDAGEQRLPALAREIREETGYSALVGRHVGTFREFVWMPEYGSHAEKICHVHLARPGPCMGPPMESDHSVLWLSPRAALAALANDGSRRMLALWLRSKGDVIEPAALRGSSSGSERRGDRRTGGTVAVPGALRRARQSV